MRALSIKRCGKARPRRTKKKGGEKQGQLTRGFKRLKPVVKVSLQEQKKGGKKIGGLKYTTFLSSLEFVNMCVWH